MKKRLNTLVASLASAAILFTSSAYANIPKSILNPFENTKKELKVGDPMPAPEGYPCYPEVSKNVIIMTYCEGDDFETSKEFYKINEKRPFALYDLETNSIYVDYKNKDGKIGPDGIIDFIEKRGIKIKIPASQKTK